jgi:hypothetical protein
LPENVDAYLAPLPDANIRVMAVTGEKLQTAFLGAGRRLANAHNNSQMYDTRFYVGFPTIAALYMNPASVLDKYRQWRRFGDYYIADMRPPWHMEIEDIFGNSFRRLLQIAGVGAYLVQPSDSVLETVRNPGNNLVLLQDMGTKGRFSLIYDRDAYDTAYVAKVVGETDPKATRLLAAAAQDFYLQKMSLEEYRHILDSVAKTLGRLVERHDALIERPAGSRAVSSTSISDRVGEQRGQVAIDGVAGPRIGLRVHCPEQECVVVYNLAAMRGWRAYVQGNPTTILRANYAFISVAVPHGEHYVGMFYAAVGQWMSELLSLLGLLGLLIVSWQMRADRQRTAPIGLSTRKP